MMNNIVANAITESVYQFNDDLLIINRRLLNWTRWAKEYSGRTQVCRSIEYRYKTPQCWWPEEAKTIIDFRDATAVEKIISGLSIEFQKPLVLHWVVHWGKRDMALGVVPLDICSSLSVRLSRDYGIAINRYKVGAQIDRAIFMIRNRLAFAS